MAAKSYQVGQIYSFVVSQLERSKTFNVRRLKSGQLSAKEQTAIERLAALILSQGLLQNLVGFPPKKKKGGVELEIVAGGRRLTAILWLIEQGKLPPDFQIPVRICTLAEATAISLAENSERVDLPPADQFRAFQTMSEHGHTVEEISAAWGVDEITIKRRLKLANVAPRLFALYEDDKATLDQLMALALTDDHATQERVWDALPEYSRSNHAIRNLITTQEVSVSSNRTAKYVGLEEYEKAGGEVRRDLFSNAGEGYMKDAALLESLAVEKLSREASALIKGQWAWVDYVTHIDHDELRKFHRADTSVAEFTEEDQAKVVALTEQRDSLEKQIADLEASDKEFTDEEQQELENMHEQFSGIESQIDKFNEVYACPDPEMTSPVGVIVTIDHSAKMNIHRGLIRPEDVKQLKEEQAAANAAAGIAPPTKSVHSEKLLRQLTAHRTAALQFMVAERTPVALVILAHKLALKVFNVRSYSVESAAQITLNSTTLTNESDEIAGNSIALEKFGELRLAWEDKLPSDPLQLFDWLLEQEQAVVLDLLAFCTAFSLTTVQGDESVHRPAAQIAKAVNLDMADWWQPTRTSYFSQVSKNHIVSIVAAEKSADVARPLADMKKIPLSETAEELMRGHRWLPEILKFSA